MLFGFLLAALGVLQQKLYEAAKKGKSSRQDIPVNRWPKLATD